MTKKIAIIGAGPGGYEAAIRAAQLGAHVYLIEKRDLGGTCLNRGCIPTKTYFKNAQIMNSLKRSKEYGIEVDGYRLDGKALLARKEKIVDTLRDGVERLISSYKNIEYLSGKGKLKAKDTVSVELLNGDRQEIKVDNIIIATGSRPTMADIKGIDLPGVIDSDELLELDTIPESLIVVGGGVIGLEFASIYQELGSQVTLLASRILKDIDRELTRRLPVYFKKQGMKVHTQIRAKEIRKEGDQLRVIAKHKSRDRSVEAVGDYVLIASGRGPVTEGLNLDQVGVDYDTGGIKVDQNFETTVEGIYAIGDVNDVGIQLAHVASNQGIYVVEKLMDQDPDINLDVYPNCVFTIPEVAYVGLMEDELREKGLDFKTSKFLFAANGKALSLGESDGFVKVFSSKSDNKILGVTIVGPNANDLIHEGALAIANQLDVDSINRTIHAHPTLSEAFMEAVHGLDNRAIHMAPPRKRR